jgi:phenylacetate-CoA ligase
MGMMNNKYFHMLRLLHNERKPLGELKDIQNVKLRRLIYHAYHHVPFYRDRFKKINLSPEDIQTTDDLYKIPIIDKMDFHKSNPADIVDHRIKNVKALVNLHTSGSSGQPLAFYADRKYNQIRKSQFLRPYITNGYGLFDRAVWFRSRPQTKRTWYQKMGFFRDHQISSNLEPDAHVQCIHMIEPTVIKGYSSILQLLASKILAENIFVPSPRLIFSDSELLGNEARRKIELAFRSNVIDIYGTYETDNAAYECHRHEGYHMSIDCLVMEFIQDGRSVNPGEEGEIVVTVLDNYAFPFIRYNMHDLAAYTDTPCSCGRTFPLMKMIAGRTYDYALKQNGVRVSSTTLMRHFWQWGNYIHEFQIIQEGLASFSVLIVPAQSYSDEITAKITKGLESDLLGAAINVHLVDQIKREASGKFLSFQKLIGDV